MALIAGQVFNIHMLFMTEKNGFHGFGVEDSTSVGKAAFAGNVDISDAEKREQNYEETFFFHFRENQPFI